MFRAGHFVAAICCAVIYVCLNPEHTPPHVLARLQAQANAEAMADQLEQAKIDLEASQKARVTLCLHRGHC